MFYYAELSMVFDLFQDDPDYASQNSIPIERILQLLFLAVRCMLHSPSISRSISNNYRTSYKDPDTMLRECKDALPLDLLSQIKESCTTTTPLSLQATSQKSNSEKPAPASTTPQ